MDTASSRRGSSCSTPPASPPFTTAGAATESQLPGHSPQHPQRRETRGEPDAVRAARPVRAGGPGKRTGGNTGTAPRADPTEKNQAEEGRESTNVRNGSRGKTVVSAAAGEKGTRVPPCREGPCGAAP